MSRSAVVARLVQVLFMLCWLVFWTSPAERVLADVGCSLPPGSNLECAAPGSICGGGGRVNIDSRCTCSFNDRTLPAQAIQDPVRWIPVTMIAAYRGNVTPDPLRIGYAKAQEQIRILNDEFGGRYTLGIDPLSCDTRIRFYLDGYYEVQNGNAIDSFYDNPGNRALFVTAIRQGLPPSATPLVNTSTHYVIITTDFLLSGRPEGGDTAVLWATTEGCVHDCTVMYYGATGYDNIDPSYAQGGAFVHEAGHFLGLRHPHHKNVIDCCETDCQTFGDLVCDTAPILSGNGAGTNCTHSDGTCAGGLLPSAEEPLRLDCSDPPQVEHTHMGKQRDTNNDPSIPLECRACEHPKIFTPGQSARMNCILGSVRQHLLGHDQTCTIIDNCGCTRNPVTLTFDSPEGQQVATVIQKGSVFTIPKDWSGKVTPSAPGVTFAPLWQSLPSTQPITFAVVECPTIRVPEDYPSISQALDGASPGSQISVVGGGAPYTEPPLMMKPCVKICARTGSGQVHVSIPNAGSSPALVFDSSCLSGSEISGLDISSDSQISILVQGVGRVVGCRVNGNSLSGWTGIKSEPSAILTVENTEILQSSGSGATGVRLLGPSSLLGVKIHHISKSSQGVGIRIDAAMGVNINIGPCVDDDGATIPSTITDCWSGVRIDGYAEPVIRSTVIRSHDLGVDIGLTATPDLGRSDSPGHNTIMLCKVRAAGGAARLEEMPDVVAMYNYWGQTPPPLPPKISPWVVATPYDASNANPGYQDTQRDVAPLVKGLSVRCDPNPADKQVLFTIESPGGRRAVDVRVVDVGGRVIRVWRVITDAAGEARVTWGATDGGSKPLRPGVYFVRVNAGGRQSGSRLVVAR